MIRGQPEVQPRNHRGHVVRDRQQAKARIGDELDLTRNKDMGRPTIDFNSPEFMGEDDE